MSPGPSTVPAPAPARDQYVDFLRGGAIFGVACIHFGGSFASSDHAWTPAFHVGLFLNQVFSFAVPLFIFLSGLLAGMARERPGDTLWAYYGRRLARIGGPYLVASLAAFYLLNSYVTWRELPSFQAQAVWLAKKLILTGIEPTLYFIPLIVALYFLQPLLRAAPRWLHAALERKAPGRTSVAGCARTLGVLTLLLHVVLGVLCYRNVLDYYTWARPNPLFWLFYFYLGLHFRELTAGWSVRFARLAVGTALVVALGLLAWDLHTLTDPKVVGAHFELSKIDYAYARPEILAYNLAVITVLAGGILLGWTWSLPPFAWLGRYSLEIYLWHIIVLYELAWRFPEVLADCNQLPELIPGMAFATCLLIAGVFDGAPRLAALARRYRLVLVRAE